MRPRKKNPLKNFGAMVKLNPYALTQKRRAILASRSNSNRRRKHVQKNRAGESFLKDTLFAPQVPTNYYDQYKVQHANLTSDNVE